MHRRKPSSPVKLTIASLPTTINHNTFTLKQGWITQNTQFSLLLYHHTIDLDRTDPRDAILEGVGNLIDEIAFGRDPCELANVIPEGAGINLNNRQGRGVDGLTPAHPNPDTLS